MSWMEKEALADLSRWMGVTHSSLCCQIMAISMLETLHRLHSSTLPIMLFRQHCLLRDKLIHVCFPSLLSWLIHSAPVLLFPLSTQSVSLSEPFSRLHVCIRVHYGNGKATKSAFNMRQRFNEFLCCFMALRELHGVIVFIWDLRATAENCKTSAFHGTMVVIVTALSPWRELEWVTFNFFLFLDLHIHLMTLKWVHLLLLSWSRTSSCYFKRQMLCSR